MAFASVRSHFSHNFQGERSVQNSVRSLDLDQPKTIFGASRLSCLPAARHLTFNLLIFELNQDKLCSIRESRYVLALLATAVDDSFSLAESALRIGRCALKST